MAFFSLSQPTLICPMYVVCVRTAILQVPTFLV